MEIKNEENLKTLRLNLNIVLPILVGAWIIGMSVVAAGLLISREIAKNSAQSQIAGVPVVEKVQIDVPAGLPVLGDNHAKVTIVEFADFQCPFCGEWQKTIFPEIKSKYIDTGKARFVFMGFPFLGAESYQAAEAASCANEQGKFWEYHDKLFTSQKGENEGTFSYDNLKKLGLELNLNKMEFNSCLDSKKYQSKNEQDLTAATNYGVQSTPTVYINGSKIEGIMPFVEYQKLIDAELSK